MTCTPLWATNKKRMSTHVAVAAFLSCKRNSVAGQPDKKDYTNESLLLCTWRPAAAVCEDTRQGKQRARGGN